MRGKIALVATLWLVAGCHQAVPERTMGPIVTLDSGRCLPSPSLQDASPIILGEPESDANEKLFDAATPCVRQQDGSVANYHAFRLPPADRPYLITMRTEPVKPAYLAVTAEFVAANGSVTRTIGAESFSFHGTSLMALLRSHAGEEFLVVRSDPRRVGLAFDQISEVSLLYSTTTTTTVSKGGKVTNVYTNTSSTPVGGSKSTNYVFSHNGSLHVTATPILDSQ